MVNIKVSDYKLDTFIIHGFLRIIFISIYKATEDLLLFCRVYYAKVNNIFRF